MPTLRHRRDQGFEALLPEEVIVLVDERTHLEVAERLANVIEFDEESAICLLPPDQQADRHRILDEVEDAALGLRCEIELREILGDIGAMALEEILQVVAITGQIHDPEIVLLAIQATQVDEVDDDDEEIEESHR